MIVELGAVASADGVAALMPAISVAGWVPMSASRLIVACCIRVSAAALPRSWLESSPQVHWTVPAPNTSPPPAPRYRVRLCSAVSDPKVEPWSTSTGALATVVEESRNDPPGREPLSGSVSHS